MRAETDRRAHFRVPGGDAAERSAVWGPPAVGAPGSPRPFTPRSLAADRAATRTRHASRTHTYTHLLCTPLRRRWALTTSTRMSDTRGVCCLVSERPGSKACENCLRRVCQFALWFVDAADRHGDIDRVVWSIALIALHNYWSSIMTIENLIACLVTSLIRSKTNNDRCTCCISSASGWSIHYSSCFVNRVMFFLWKCCSFAVALLMCRYVFVCWRLW